MYQLITPAYSLGYATRTITNRSYAESVYLEKREGEDPVELLPFLHFSGWVGKSFDVEMIENSEENFQTVPKQMFSLWFAKALSFIRLL